MDYRVNAAVRRHLTSRWVDVSRLQIATTNGVVYLIGTLEPTSHDALERAGQHGITNPIDRLVGLVTLIEKELRRIQGVRDLAFKLENARKKGNAWSASGVAAAKARGTGQVR